MPTNAETVSRRPEIVIVGHNQCQAEPGASPLDSPVIIKVTAVSEGFSRATRMESRVPDWGYNRPQMASIWLSAGWLNLLESSILPRLSIFSAAITSLSEPRLWKFTKQARYIHSFSQSFFQFILKAEWVLGSSLFITASLSLALHHIANPQCSYHPVQITLTTL